MRTILQIVLSLALLAETASAFTLIGPYEDWMQPTNGFRYATDIGGPMNFGEEYRWNVPVVTYSFDQSFMDYFGAAGVAAVEQMFQILNALQPASQIDPASYPPESLAVNYQAQALYLIDLKSKTLSALLEQLGLAEPSRHAFCVHDFTFSGGLPVAATVQRNFDPISFSPSSLVNDTDYTYNLVTWTNGNSIYADAHEYLVDPMATFQTAVADGGLNAGAYYTGLTRDDVGGLSYLLHTNNPNAEILLPGVHGVGPNAGSYVNQAVRRGVDKITFVRRDYDGILGQLFTPYTNQFTDYYVSNSIMMGQQVERVITEPDILFTTGETGIFTPHISRTGTSNWWNSASLSLSAGPGIIRPPIKLTFSKPSEVIMTADWWPGSSREYFPWGSFDWSTNAPVTYPVGTPNTDLTLNLKLWRGIAEVGSASWQIALSPAQSVVVLTSTNLVNWSPYLVLGTGRNVEWTHHVGHSQRYFRIVPN